MGGLVMQAEHISDQQVEMLPAHMHVHPLQVTACQSQQCIAQPHSSAGQSKVKDDIDGSQAAQKLLGRLHSTAAHTKASTRKLRSGPTGTCANDPEELWQYFLSILARGKAIMSRC